MLIITVVVGFVLWALCRILYNTLLMTVPRVLLIAIIFCIFSLIMTLVVFVASHMDSTYMGDLFSGDGETYLFLAVGVVIIFALAALFQWIYGLNFSQTNATPTSYVFVIDDSGSMEGNDPGSTRYSAIRRVMDDTPEGFPYMVYNFTTDCYIIRDMGPVTSNDSFSGESNGGTDIQGALATVLGDHDSGLWDGGDNPKVLLLSDGESMGFIRKTLNRYAKEGIAVSTVGFGSVNDRLMQKIANRTGGVYIYVDDIDTLSQAIETATSSYAARDLVSSRAVTKLSFLYGLMRVIFLTILGAAIGLLSMIAYGRNDSTELTLISSVATAFVGALVMEIGTSLGLSDVVMWAILWVLIATLVCSYKKRYGASSSSSLSRF